MSKTSAPNEALRYLERAGGSSAGSQVVILPVLLLLSLGSLSRLLGQDVGQFAVDIRTVIGAALASWIFYMAASTILRLILKARWRWRGTLFLLIFGLTESVRAFALDGLLLANHQSIEINWGLDGASSFLTGVTLYAIATFVAGDSRAYRDEVRELLEAKQKLQLGLAGVRSEVQTKRDELLTSVREVIAVALASVAEQRTTNDAIDGRLVTELTRISNDVVRPLSHDVFAARDDLISGQASGKQTRVSWARVFVLSTLTRPFRPIALTVVVFMLILPVVFVAITPTRAVLSVLVLFLGTLGWFGLARWLLFPFFARVPVAIRFVIMVGVYGFYSFVLAIVINYLTSQNGQDSGFVQAIYVIVLAIPLIYVLSLTPAIRAARAEVLADLAASNVELSWLSARLSAELWTDRRSVAKTLHSDVQGVFVAAAFRLQRALDRGEETGPAIEEAFEILNLAANFAVSTSEPPTMAHSVETLTERWRGVISLRYEATTEAAAALDGDRVARQLLQETLAEFVVNSVKHGLASLATVRVSIQAASLLHLEFENNGAPIPEGVVFDGLGSRMMRTMGLNARYENLEGGGVRLFAEVPISRPQGPGFEI